MSMDIEKELTIAEGKKNYVIILRCISPEIQYNAPPGSYGPTEDEFRRLQTH